MKVVAIIGRQEYFWPNRYIYLCFGGTKGQLSSVMRAVKNAGSSERGCY